ncbi:GGDEF domain-containing protein [Thalassospira marina]|uniref:diguanylate cyclase n=1 Tax=Thalassospira marina TaxID=2048283 RepID=A0ABN5FCN1_9PROT|nr:GGDEF domain-containing protein [Thalassospira marina]AUG52508.1 GGDEF domain-containing protein [Thalassospira marina]
MPFFHNDALRLRRAEILRHTGRLAAAFVLLYLFCAPFWDGSYTTLFTASPQNVSRLVVALIAVWIVLDGRVGARLRRKVPLLPFGLLMLSVGGLFALSLMSPFASGTAAMTHGLLMLAMGMLLAAMPLSLLEVCAFIAIPAALDVSGLLPDSSGAIDAGVMSTRVLFFVMTMTAALSALLQLYRTIINIQQIAQDPLTGAYSRGFGSEMLFLGFEAARRGCRPFSIAFVDLDNFKQVNDQFGHDRGDRILAHSGASLIAGLRRGDVVVRWGGEEFLVLLPGLTTAQAREVMRRVVENGLADLPNGARQQCSVGIAERIEDKIEEPHSLVDLADQRMYEIKKDQETDGVGTAKMMAAQPVRPSGTSATVILHPACDASLSAGTVS